MSGVNRNILKNTGIPVMAQDQIPMELVSTAGTRFVLLNWPVKTYISSSQGGDCEGITVQWTTDSTLASEPDSAYPNLTSSVISCDSSSQIPLTSSALWSIFIDSAYNTGSNTNYYIRSFQNSAGGGRGPYSNVLSLETRSPKLYGTSEHSNAYNYEEYQFNPPSSPWFPGCTGSVLVFTVDSFNPNTGQLQAWSGDTNGGSAVTMSVTSGSLQPMKAGGFNYDSIQTNGATMSFSLVGSPSGSRGGVPLYQTNSIQDGGLFNWGTVGGRVPYPDPATSPYLQIIGNAQNFPCALGTLCNEYHMRSWTTSVGILSGSLTIIGNEGYRVKYSAVSSSTGVDVCIISGGVEYGQGFPTASTTINGIIGTVGDYTGGNITWRLNGINVGTSSVPSNPARTSIGNQITIETSPDCVFRTLNFGDIYDTQTYVNQYGNPYQVWSTQISSSTVLPIPSQSVLQLWSGFGYGYTPYTQSGYPQGVIGVMDNNNVSSKWSAVNPQTPNSLNTGSNGWIFGGQYITVLSSSIAGTAETDSTIQFAGLIPNGLRYGLLGTYSKKSAVLRSDVSGSAMFLDLLNTGGGGQYRYQVTANDTTNQLLTIIKSGSNMSVYQNLTKLTPTVGTPGNPSNSGSWNLFTNNVPGGEGFVFGNVQNDVSFAPYVGNLESLLVYSRSLNDSEISASYNYFI